jgi:hypothetical protein
VRDFERYALWRCVHSPRNDPHHAPALNQAGP